MGLGSTLVGALVGAAVGVGLHQFLEVGLQYEAPWFAIVIGALTGLGVRQATKSLGNVSYLRGAIAGIVALGAIVGSIFLVSVLLAKRDTSKTGKPIVAANAQDDAADDEQAVAEGDDAATVVEADARTPAGTSGAGRMGARPEEFNTLQFIFMGVGTFLAYAFGQGSAPRTLPPHVEGSEELHPQITDPSN